MNNISYEVKRGVDIYVEESPNIDGADVVVSIHKKPIDPESRINMPRSEILRPNSPDKRTINLPTPEKAHKIVDELQDGDNERVMQRFRIVATRLGMA